MPADELFEQLNNNSVSEVSNVICITMFLQFCIWIFYCILHLLKWNTKNEKKKYRSFSLSPYGTGTGKLWNKPSLLPVFVNEAWLKHSHAPLSPLSLAALFHNSRVECLWLRPYSSQNPKYLLCSSLQKNVVDPLPRRMPDKQSLSRNMFIITGGWLAGGGGCSSLGGRTIR